MDEGESILLPDLAIGQSLAEPDGPTLKIREVYLKTNDKWKG